MNNLKKSSEDVGMSKQDLEKTLQSLVDKGLVRKVLVDGEVKYQLTYAGRATALHLDSDSNTKN